MKRFCFVLFICLHSLSIRAQDLKLNWAKSSGDTIYQYGQSVTADGSGSVYTTGMFWGTVDFDPGPGTFNLSHVGSGDIFVQKLDAAGNFIWARSVGGTATDGVSSIVTDISGNVYLTGHFFDTVDFDPGAGIHNRTVIGASDVFVLKLDAAGNFVWVKTFGEGGSDGVKSMAIDKWDNLYLSGTYMYTVDFDPGLAVYNLTSIGNDDNFILKLDKTGNFKWANSIGESGRVDGKSITTDPWGNVYVTGFFSDTADFDPGLPAFNVVSNGFWDIYIQKFDSNGNFIWVKTQGSSGYDYGISVCSDLSGNVFLTGVYKDSADFDPGIGTSMFYSNGNYDIFIQKLDSAGNFKWAKSIGGPGGDGGYSITTDAVDNVYITGVYSDTVDFDPGITGINLLSEGLEDLFILKLDTGGNLIWVNSLGGTGNDGAGSIHVDASDNLYLTGGFQDTVDFDPDTTRFSLVANGGNDVFTLKLNQDSCGTLALVFDSLRNISCIDSGYALAHAINGVAPYTYSWNTLPITIDSTVTFDSAGIYSISVTAGNGCKRTASVLINAPTSSAGVDLNTNLIASSFRSGFLASIWLDAFNDRCIDTSGQLIVVLDPLVNYSSSSIVPNQVAGDSLIWNFGNMNYDSTHLQPQVILTTKTSAQIGDTVCFTVIINPIPGDVNPSNNIKHYCFPVINAYDPNDKQVYPQGVCPERYVLKNEVLTYTLRFQNTGTAEAINVHVIDSISSFLNLNSVRIVGQSHPMYTEVLPGNVLNFVFNDIHLPDSNTNEAASHAFAIFQVSPLPGLPDGTVIENIGEIYFDLNPAIVTNTISNTLVDVLPACLVGIKEQVNARDHISLYPNPTDGILHIDADNPVEVRIMDLRGKTLKVITTEMNRIDVRNLSSGIYLLQLKIGERDVVRKFVKE